MNRDPFLRLALIALCTGYVVAVAAVWQQLGVVAAIAGVVFGVALAVGLTVEFEPDGAADSDARARLLHRLRFRPEKVRELRKRGEL